MEVAPECHARESCTDQSLEEDKAPGGQADGITWWQATFAIVVIIVGAGIMALAQLPMRGGTYLSVVFIVLCGITITEGGMDIYRTISRHNEEAKKTQGRLQIVSYTDIGREAFGEPGELVAFICHTCYFVGSCSTYAVLIAESAAHLTDSWLSVEDYVVALYPLFALPALLPNVTALSKFVPAALICVLLLSAIMIVKSCVDVSLWQSWPSAYKNEIHRSMPTSFMDIGIVVSVLFGSFGVNGSIPGVLHEMKKPTEFPFAFKTAMVLVGVLYIIVMLTSYWAYGEFQQPDIVHSLTSAPAGHFEAFNVPFDHWTGPKAPWLEDVLSSLLLVKMAIGFPLNLVATFYSLQTFKHTRSFFPLGSVQNKVMRLSLVAAIVLFARLVPDFAKLFSLVCSVFSPMLQTILPFAFGYKLRSLLPAGAQHGLIRIMVHFGMTLLALFTIIIGFMESLNDIIDS